MSEHKTKWEYLAKCDCSQAELNSLGLDRWELMTVAPPEMSEYPTMFYFKRPLLP